jgi:hypothetical protein
VAQGNRLIVIRQDGLVFGADVVGTNIQPAFQFTGAPIGFNPEDRFMVAIGNTLVVIRQDGLVFGADVVGRDIQPVFQFTGAPMGFNPEDRFMVAQDNSLIVIRLDGLVFGADVVGRDIKPVFMATPEQLNVIRQDGLVFGADVVGRDIKLVFQFTGAPMGFNPEDRFMVALGNTLVVIRRDGLVFGADVVGRDIQPAFQFTGAPMGFNPEDRFMVAQGNRLIVIRQDGLVFGADVVGRDIQPVFQFTGAPMGFNPQDRFMVAAGNVLGARLNLHLKVLDEPTTVPRAQMVRSMQILYARYGINVVVSSEEGLNLPLLHDVDVGSCRMGDVTTAEQNQLFANRNNAGPNDVCVYFVLSTTPIYNGCAQFPPGSPGAVVAAIGSPWTMAHEVGHVLGLNHVDDPPATVRLFDRLMTGGGTWLITNPPPDLVQTEIATMLGSPLTS